MVFYKKSPLIIERARVYLLILFVYINLTNKTGPCCFSYNNTYGSYFAFYLSFLFYFRHKSMNLKVKCKSWLKIIHL
ncbi:MAG TPA: hypothetical protein DCQ26_17080 [Marinilabiliales bacterium]|nr:MAG: hypothetical protein A2W84_14235 [Bacteroidetes bacterium GWC2_40_13]OFX74255.1 MAG: hypothetical protein A2W96_03165 [Bacteroidetes bacterium GWD2_40_43]OFX92767.1 MAG: hypothetical protein A2W97_00415 [Bacteroidetes bacterium GWE2_40_63]OFY23184.1 MAG: hypothetical protein A2W88_12430 [Bacteroidetes bacterium GWF2_40_13]OFZ27778.1 MAG: hypothetical protein A2437_01030 [Bacteroidetes bacterium RIFOXYC2_FULL_40_12]HAN00310.1 hypothetical protein [Marinilabiliales bacterium]